MTRLGIVALAALVPVAFITGFVFDKSDSARKAAAMGAPAQMQVAIQQ